MILSRSFLPQLPISRAPASTTPAKTTCFSCLIRFSTVLDVCGSDWSLFHDPDSSDAAELSDALHADPFAAKRVAGLPPGSELDFGGLRELSAYEQTEVPQP